jgi:hypothetical protein
VRDFRFIFYDKNVASNLVSEKDVSISMNKKSCSKRALNKCDYVVNFAKERFLKFSSRKTTMCRLQIHKYIQAP